MRKLLALCLVLIFGGCTAVGPNYQRPAVDVPQQWSAASDGVSVASWRIFNDPVLLELLAEGERNNLDLALAVARVDEARALLGRSNADLYPAIGATVDHSRTRQSQRSAMPLPAGVDPLSSSTRVALSASYEVDLWGKLRRATEAARAELLGSQAAHDTVRLALASDIASAYFALLSLDQQVAITRRTVAARNESYKLQKMRFDAGISSEYELLQIEAETATALAQQAALEGQRAQQENALSVLLGRSPRDIVAGALSRGAATTPTAIVVPAGLPSDLLLRRPDIVEAEQRLVAANARIGVARAGYFPSISLTGYLGSESTALSDLFSGPTRIFQFATSLLQPIFNANRVGYEVDAANARQQQALAQYRLAIANAFRDVQDGLVGQRQARLALEAEQARVNALLRAHELVNLRYRNGTASFLEVLDAERNLLQAQINRADAERRQRAAIADLFKALGGGWDEPRPVEPAPSAVGR